MQFYGDCGRSDRKIAVELLRPGDAWILGIAQKSFSHKLRFGGDVGSFVCATSAARAWARPTL